MLLLRLVIGDTPQTALSYAVSSCYGGVSDDELLQGHDRGFNPPDVLLFHVSCLTEFTGFYAVKSRHAFAGKKSRDPACLGQR